MAEWARRLLGLTVLAGALEFLLPDGNLRGFSRMVLGLVLVLTMASPLLSFRAGPEPLLPSVGESEIQGKEELLRRVFDLRLREELNQLLEKYGYTCTAAKGSWEEVGKLAKVEVELDPPAQVPEEVAGIVARHLGLEAEQIQLMAPK